MTDQITNQIMGDPLLLASLVLPLLPLLLALLLMLRSGLRAYLKARAARITAAREAALRESLPVFPEAERVLDEDLSDDIDAIASSAPQVGNVLEDETAEDEDADSEALSPEMNDILSSVFADDEGSEAREALLRHTEAIDAHTLAVFAESIAKRLRQRSA